MEDRCRFLEEEIPRIESVHCAHRGGNLASTSPLPKLHRLTALAEELRTQLAALTAEWEELMAQLEEA